jgi:Subtilisin inhibitor-like
MRRILATSIAATIPIVLPVHAVDAYAKPAPPPVASGHYRPIPAHAHGGHASHAKHATRKRTSAPTGDTQGRPENDVKVDMGPDAEQGRAPEANTAPDRGAVGAPRSGVGARGVKNRAARPARSKPASRPGTGADAGFADADDPALPAEAAAALKEAAELQESTQQATRPRGAAPKNTAPNTTAPGTTAPQGAVPAAPAPAPRGTGRSVGRPAQEPQDLSTNQTSTRKAGRAGAARSMPTAFFNANPAPQGSRLVLHTNAGNSPERTVTLQCDPAGGTHPKATEACADVTKAGGNLAQMPANANPRACFMIYAPVTVTAQGEWQGQAVRFTEKFPNSCVMRDKTGSVFDF